MSTKLLTAREIATNIPNLREDVAMKMNKEKVDTSKGKHRINSDRRLQSSFALSHGIARTPGVGDEGNGQDGIRP